MTKKTSTPTNPPENRPILRWNSRTGRTATARRPSMSARYLACAVPVECEPGAGAHPLMPAADSQRSKKFDCPMLLGGCRLGVDDRPVGIASAGHTEIRSTLRRSFAVKTPALRIGHGLQGLRHRRRIAGRHQDAVFGENHAGPDALARQIRQHFGWA